MRKFIAATLFSMAAFLTPSVGTSTASASTQNVWHNYYYNYFTSEQSCNNRGYAMTTPGHAGYIPGMIAYYCYYTGPRWSMDVLD